MTYPIGTNCKPINRHASKINLLLFAGDIIVLSESPIGLQNYLNDRFQYCENWELNVNLKKTKILIFNERNTRLNCQLR